MATQTPTFPHVGRWLALAQLLRLPNVFTAWADIFLAAFAIGIWPELIIPFFFLLLASTFLYWSGMVWNDFFDVDQDRRDGSQTCPVNASRVPTRGMPAQSPVSLTPTGHNSHL